MAHFNVGMVARFASEYPARFRRNSHIWRLSGGATVVDDTGDLYRLRCGQSADETYRLDLLGDHVPWAEVSGDIDLYQGQPNVTALNVGELVMREIGTRTWLKAPHKLPIGHYELGWRKGNELLDRRRIAVVPKEAELQCSGRGHAARYTLNGFGRVILAPDEGAPVRLTVDGQWVADTHAPVVHHFTAQLNWGDSPPLQVSIKFPCAASIARWDGHILPNNATVTLDDLADLVAVDEGAMELIGELRGDRGASAEMNWLFDQSMPLSAIADDLVDLMLQSNSLESSVRLGMHDGLATCWNVRQFAVSLRREGHGIVANPAIVAPNTQLCGRRFGDPTNERVFGTYSLLHEANHRPIHLPEDIGGLWLVYLRDGERMLTRPQYIPGLGFELPPVGTLGQVMALPLGPDLSRAIRDFLDFAEGDASEAYTHVMQLVDLAASLRGLPPSTFEIFKALYARPTVLARMMLSAPPAARHAVFALSRALPFAWYLVPKQSWQSAQRMLLDAALIQLGELPKRMEYALEIVAETVSDLALRSPLVGALFEPKADISLEEAAQAFLRRARERIRTEGQERYRGQLGHMLPRIFDRFDPAVRNALDAPCAAALAALGYWQPSIPEVRHMKSIARGFPSWFFEAFAAILVEHA